MGWQRGASGPSSGRRCAPRAASCGSFPRTAGSHPPAQAERSSPSCSPIMQQSDWWCTSSAIKKNQGQIINYMYLVYCLKMIITEKDLNQDKDFFLQIRTFYLKFFLESKQEEESLPHCGECVHWLKSNQSLPFHQDPRPLGSVKQKIKTVNSQHSQGVKIKVNTRPRESELWPFLWWTHWVVSMSRPSGKKGAQSCPRGHQSNAAGPETENTVYILTGTKG